MKTNNRPGFQQSCCSALLFVSECWSQATTRARPSPHVTHPSRRCIPALSTPCPRPLQCRVCCWEGKGQISQSSSRCISASCAGTFTATLRGRPLGKADLTLHLSVNPATDAFTGCNQVTGTGGINDNAYTVNLVGQLCAPGIGYTLSGTVQIYSAAAASGTAAVGTLLAFGGTNIPQTQYLTAGRA
jgi:hypothetical protein